MLFLQSLQLSAGTATVLEGAGLGLAMTFAVGAVTFYFQRKLPYKKMLIVTGVFIGFVLVVMVGQTVAHDAGHRLGPDHADRRHAARTGPGCGSASTRRSRRSARRSPPPPS